MTESCTAHCDLTRKVVHLRNTNIVFPEVPDMLSNHKVVGLSFFSALVIKILESFVLLPNLCHSL